MIKKIILLLVGCGLMFSNCDSGAFCSSTNKSVTITNNTGIRIKAIQFTAYSNYTFAVPLGDIDPFEFKTFNVPPNELVRTGDPNSQTSYVDLLVNACVQNQELIYED